MKRASALAVAASALLFLTVAFPIWRGLPATYPLDGQTDWALARAFVAGDNPYTPQGLARHHVVDGGRVAHPPTCALWFLPLAGLPLERLNQSWGVFIIALLAAQLVLACAALRLPLAGAFGFLAATVILLQGWFIQHLAIAQTSALVAFLLVLGWWSLRRGHDRTGGAAVGLACTLKLFPGALLVFLLVTRRWRALAAAGAAYLAVAAVVTARFGLSCWWLFAAQSERVHPWLGKRYNASLEAVLLRLTHPGAADAPVDGWVPAVYPYLLAALLGVTLGLVGRRAHEPRGWDLSFALIAVVGAYLNPWVWGHYEVLLAWPALLAGAAIVRGWPSRPLVAAAALLVVMGAETLRLFPQAGAPAAELASWICWPAMIAALAALLWRRDQGRARALTAAP